MNYMINHHFLQYSFAFSVGCLLVVNFLLMPTVQLPLQVLEEMDGDVDASIEYMIADRLAMGTDDMEGDPYLDYACKGKPFKCPGSRGTINLEYDPVPVVLLPKYGQLR